MKTIVLTDQEASELKELYTLELARVKRQAQHFEQILGKLEDVVLPAKPKAPVEKKPKTADIKVEPKKRGRPRKAVAMPDALPAEEKKTRVRKSKKEVLEVSIPEAPKKKRGRPRKVTDTAVDAVVAPPKRKGRPKKEKPAPKLKKVKAPKVSKAVTADAEIADVPKVKKARKARKVTKVPKKKPAKKSGMKSGRRRPERTGISWPEFVFNTLAEKQTELTVKEFVDIAMEKYGFEAEKMPLIRNNVAACLSNMAKKPEVLASRTNEEKRKVFGLPSRNE